MQKEGDYLAEGFDFNIADVAALLPLTIRRRTGASMDVDCFYDGCNGARRGKLNINFAKNCYKCNYCGNNGGMLDLYADYLNISRSEAYREISEALNCGKIQEIRKKQPKVELVPQSPSVDYEQRHQTYAMMSQLLTLSNAHKEHLMSRGLSLADIEERGYRSTPVYGFQVLTKKLIDMGCKVEGIPGFYKMKSGVWTVNFSSYCSGILVPYLSVNRKIQGFQIRLDKPIVEESREIESAGIETSESGTGGKDGKKKVTKYIWFSSVNKNYGASSGSPVSFVGNPGDEVVYFTEGALKAHVAHKLSGKSFLAVAGTGSLGNVPNSLNELRTLGTRIVVEAYDADKYMNEKVMKDSLKLKEIIRECQLTSTSAEWPYIEYGDGKNTKGVDDYLVYVEMLKKQGKTMGGV